jgi:6-phosphofructokinase
MYITIFIFVRRRFEKIVILTGDYACFNATIRSIIRTANNYGISVVGIK